MKTLFIEKTPRGDLHIKAVFATYDEARAAGWCEYFTNDNGNLIMCRQDPNNEYSQHMAMVSKA